MGGKTVPRPTLDREGLSVRRKEGSCLVGPCHRHLHLHAALGGLEHGGEARLLANAEQSGLAPMFEGTEGGVQVKVPAARADEARALLASD